MQATNTLLTLGFLFFFVIYIIALVKPRQKITAKYFGIAPSRKTITKKLLPVVGVLFILVGITAPATPTQTTDSASSQTAAQQKETDTKRIQEAARLRAIEEAKPQTKQVTEKAVIPFATETKTDPSLPAGQTRVEREGANGEQAFIYDVITVSGKETARTLKTDVVIVQPVSKVVANGTYVYTPPAQTYSASSGDGYTNSQGNHIASPSSNPAGATAQCSDGSYSYSQSRSGTCSHHGGVAVWL